MKYAALFRGINVGGKNVVRMADLEQLLFHSGLSKVRTYIQSGNAVFETALAEADLLDKIKTGFLDRFGFESNVLIRSMEEIRVLIEQFPITSAEIAEAQTADPQVEHLYVYFLGARRSRCRLIPSAESISAPMPFGREKENCICFATKASVSRSLPHALQRLLIRLPYGTGKPSISCMT